MGSKPLPSATGLAKQVLDAIRVELGHAKISGPTALANKAGWSEKYARPRYKGETSLTLVDVEHLCLILDLGDPGRFIAQVEDGTWRSPHDNVTDFPVVGGAKEGVDLFKVPLSGREAASRDNTAPEQGRDSS